MSGKAARKPRSAAEKLAQANLPYDQDVLVNPYPAYEELPLDELRELAEDRGVEIPWDVEKAHLLYALRALNPHDPRWNMLPLDGLREAAADAGVGLDEEFEIAHLITALRAADTGI